MPQLRSKIGNTSLKSPKPMRNFIVDDPTAPQPQKEEKQPINVPPLSPSSSPQIPVNVPEGLKPGEWKKITPEEFNRYEQSKKTFTASEPVISEELEKNNAFVQEDADFLGRLQVAREERNKLPQENKNIIEVLLGLRKKTADIEIEGHKITLQNITSLQAKNSLEKIKGLSGIDQIYTFKHTVVAFALYAIDGVLLEEILGEDDNEQLRLDIINNMDHSVVDDLYSAYLQKISLKINVNSEQKAKEVVSDLKK